MAQLGCYDLHPGQGTTAAAVSEGHLASLSSSSPFVSTSVSVLSRAAARSASPITSPLTLSEKTRVAGDCVVTANSTVQNNSTTKTKTAQAKLNNDVTMSVPAAGSVKRFSSLNTMPMPAYQHSQQQDQTSIPLEHRLSIYDNLPSTSSSLSEHDLDIDSQQLLVKSSEVEVIKQRSTPHLATGNSDLHQGHGGHMMTPAAVVKSCSSPARGCTA